MGDVTTPQDPARDQVEGTAGAPPTTSRRRGRWWHLAGGVVALLLVAWIGIGLNPRFADGYVAQLGAPLVEVEDPSGAPDAPPWGTYEVTDPPGDEAEFMVSFRNTGWVPVTLTRGRDDLVVERVQFVVLDPRGGVGGEPRVDQITVPPGASVGVWQTVSFPCGATYTAGNGVAPGPIPLRARSLGLTRDLDLPQTARVSLLTSTDRSPTCGS